MRLKGSRYSDSKPFTPASDGTAFPGLRPRDIGSAPGVVEHVVTDDDRLDLLSFRYYNDSRLGWRILDANPELVSGGDLKDYVGRAILIPRDFETGGRR